CHVVSLRRRQDSARLPSSWSVLTFRRRSVSKICRSGSCAFLSQCMCQSRVAASPDWTTTTGFCCAETSRPARMTTVARARAQAMRRYEVDSGRVIESLLFLKVVHGSPDVAGLEIRVERVAERVAQEVDPHDGDEQRRAGEEREPVARVHELAALGEHAAPRRDGEGDTEAEKGQAGLGEDRARHAERRHDDE